MITNGKDIPSGTVITTEVCIIGSGPAGITVAWLLQKAGLKVTLIEGSRDFGSNWKASWPDKAKLYNGTADGLFADNEPNFLILPQVYQTNPSERERVYGGTSAHWGGQSRPLDPITFQARPGFPGWPITREDLDPYYAKAAALCVLYSDDFSAEYWAKVLSAGVPSLAGFDVEMYQFIGPSYLNFATRIFDGTTTIGDSAANVILNASQLDFTCSNGVVSAITAASMNDQSQPDTQFTIQADIFVLACGAVANARQLLLSDIGNEHDQVGRNFICHPLTNAQPIGFRKSYLTDAQLRLMNGQTLNGARTVPWQDSNGVQVTGRFSPTAEEQTSLGIGSCWFWAGYGQYYFEQAPNPASRVTLDDTTDPVFGQKQTRITWALGQIDENTYNQTTTMFKAAVADLGGEVTASSWDQVKPTLVVNGHHIGTTRMSNDPADGVVDANLKVHSVDNLYVAGSSVFPSTGISNPTFTIIALSIRLAEHLIAELSS